MRPHKINVAVKVFQRSIMTCIIQRYKDVLDVFLKTRRNSELEDTDKARNVGFRVHGQRAKQAWIICLLR